MFWKKRKLEQQQPTLEKLLPILKIIEVDIVKIVGRLDVIEAKFKNRLFKKKEEVEDLEEKTGSDINEENLRNSVLLPDKHGLL